MTNAKGTAVTPPEKSPVGCKASLAVWVVVRDGLLQSFTPLKDPCLSVHHTRASELTLEPRCPAGTQPSWSRGADLAPRQLHRGARTC